MGMDGTLAIREVAEQTGMNAGTIRMWEQRYGFPVPERTPSGYRRYRAEDVEALQRVLVYKERGLSVPAALERARAASSAAVRPSLFAAVARGGRVPARMLRKRTLLALSNAIEDETMARCDGPVVIGAFQRVRNYRAAEHRYRRLATVADMTVVFADFDQVRDELGQPVEIPIDLNDAIGHEWAVVVDAPSFSVCLSAWEPPVAEPPPNDLDRIFETFWTLDSDAVRAASRAGAECARPASPEVAGRIDELLEGRPQASDVSAAGLETLTARMVDYLESA